MEIGANQNFTSDNVDRFDIIVKKRGWGPIKSVVTICGGGMRFGLLERWK